MGLPLGFHSIIYFGLTCDTGLRVCYGDLDSKEDEIGRTNVCAENVDGEQVRDVEHVAKDEPLLTDLKW